MDQLHLLLYLVAIGLSVISLVVYITTDRKRRKTQALLRTQLVPIRQLGEDEATAAKELLGAVLQAGQPVYKISGEYSKVSFGSGTNNTDHHWLGGFEVELSAGCEAALLESNEAEVTFIRRRGCECGIVLSLNGLWELRWAYQLESKWKRPNGEIEEEGVFVLEKRPLTRDEIEICFTRKETRFFSGLLTSLALACAFFARGSIPVLAFAALVFAVGLWLFLRRRPAPTEEVTRLKGELAQEEGCWSLGAVALEMPAHWTSSLSPLRQCEMEVILSRSRGSSRGQVMSLDGQFSVVQEGKRAMSGSFRAHLTQFILIGSALLFLCWSQPDLVAQFKITAASLSIGTELKSYSRASEVFANPSEIGREIRFVGTMASFDPDVGEWVIPEEILQFKPDFSAEKKMAQSVSKVWTVFESHLRTAFGVQGIADQPGLLRKISEICARGNLSCEELLEAMQAVEEKAGESEDPLSFFAARLFEEHPRFKGVRLVSPTQHAEIRNRTQALLTNVEFKTDDRIAAEMRARNDGLKQGNLVRVSYVSDPIELPRLNLRGEEFLSGTKIDRAFESLAEETSNSATRVLDVQGIVTSVEMRDKEILLSLNTAYRHSQPLDYSQQPIVILLAAILILFHLQKGIRHLLV